MKMQLKFKNQKAMKTCFTYVDGHGFYYRNHNKDRILEFCYEYTLRDVEEACNTLLGLEGMFETIME